MSHRDMHLNCPLCKLSMRLKAAKDQFNKLVIEYECVFCLESCDIITENWTNKTVMQPERNRLEVN